MLNLFSVVSCIGGLALFMCTFVISVADGAMQTKLSYIVFCKKNLLRSIEIQTSNQQTLTDPNFMLCNSGLYYLLLSSSPGKPGDPYPHC
nr:hypothetical protein Iba_chr04bCG4030 [Ipomoea batatas]GMD31780.1 hypothetical protein Iba_scaffold43760CG0030 [Ipomoea batatas]